ncbi:MAG TPA: AAA family ATPase [Verrucomicrobiae bacterium]|nr:AAA family ATPase [Verrucomicrobiae bacterium]
MLELKDTFGVGLSMPQIPDHELIRCIGAGSYGEVWLAKNVVGTHRAVKVVQRRKFTDARPFEREFMGMRKFEPISRTHPGFVGILQIGRNDSAGYFYYVMELADDLVSGATILTDGYSPRTLSRELAKCGRFSIGDCIQLGLSLAVALENLHKHGLVHRDIKPSNIIFINGIPKLADIGLVTDTATTTTGMGTLGYAAPDCVVSPAADLYSLGKVLYESWTGKDCRQFPDLPSELTLPAAEPLFLRFNEILLKACEHEPQARYQSARDVYSDLWRCAQAAKLPGAKPALASADGDLPTPPECERKLLTVLCLSVVLSNEADPEDAQVFMTRCLEALKPAIFRYEGTLTQVLGDGLTAVFGAPVASEDHPQRAVHAALESRRVLERCAANLKECCQSDFELRISINRGLVIAGPGKEKGQYTASGETVSLTSRLLSLVKPGQILVTAETHKAVKDYFFTHPVGEKFLRVNGRPMRLFEVTGAQAPQNRLEATAAAGLSPFVGRARELGLLHERLGQAAEGQGQVVVLAGEPGVGKSRLLLEFRQSAQVEEVSWVTGRSLSFGHQIAYLPIIDLLKNLFEIEESDQEEAVTGKLENGLRALGEEPGMGLPLLKYLLSLGCPEPLVAEMEAQQRRLMIFELLRKLILKRAQLNPLVLMIEDLHWVDKTSEAFLVSLAESIKMSRALLVLTYRPTYRSPFPDWSYVTRVMLQQLSTLESAELTKKILDGAEPPAALRRLIADKTEGNPFFVEEMIKSLLETGALVLRDGKYEANNSLPEGLIPETIQDVIMCRIDHLEASPKRALQLAAVIGREFSVRLLETIAELDEPLPESLKQLKGLELIYERSLFPEHTCIFKHALTQEVAYHSLLIQRRKELHRLVAAAIEELYSSRLSDFFGILAYHYEKGEEWERALDYLVRAAEASHRVGAYREEASLLSRAMPIAQRLGKTPLVADLRGRRGSAWVKLGSWAEAKPDLEAALQELPASSAERQAELLLDLAGACFWKLDVPEMCRYTHLGHDVARKTSRKDLIAASEAWLAAAQQCAGNLQGAARLFKRALGRGADYCSASHAMYPLNLYWRGRLGEAVERSREVADLYRHLSDAFAATFGHPHLGLALAAQGRYREAMVVFQEARQLGLKHEVWTFHARAIAMSAGFHLDVFDFEGNEAIALEARERARFAGFAPSLVSAGVDLIFNFSSRGEIARAEELLAETAQAAKAVGGWHGWLWDLRLTQARAELALRRKRWREALGWAEESFARNCRKGRIKYRIAALISKATALVALNRKREAVADLRMAIRLARPVGDPALLLRACCALLDIEGNDRLLVEARATAKRIYQELPEGHMRDRFQAAEAVRRLGNF